MKKIISVLLATLLIVAMIAPLTALADAKTYYVKTNTGKGLNMRNDISTKSGDIIMSIPYGAEVTVYSWHNNKQWAMVSYKDRLGYVFARYLSTKKPAPVVKPAPKKATKTVDEIMDEGNPPLSIEIALAAVNGSDYGWEYTITEPDVARVVENGYVEAEGTDTFRIDGVAFGFSEVTFYYMMAGDAIEQAKHSVTYTIYVDENLDVRVYDTSVHF